MQLQGVTPPYSKGPGPCLVGETFFSEIGAGGPLFWTDSRLLVKKYIDFDMPLRLVARKTSASRPKGPLLSGEALIAPGLL